LTFPASLRHFRSPVHYFGAFLDSGLAANPTYAKHSFGYTEAALVDHTSGSVHTGLSIAQLAACGTLAPHVHSYEEGFYILSGEVTAGINDQTYRLGPGDYGCIKVGTSHAWRNDASTPVRWLAGTAAAEAGGMGRHRASRKTAGRRTMALDPPTKGNLLSHFDVSQIPPGDEAAWSPRASGRLPEVAHRRKFGA
jgi:quercetin dioxygenase-like cupin family protein